MASPSLDSDSDADLPVAATVVIVRDGAEGPEVLLLKRPDRGSFAGAWVFPGGKVEPGDGDLDGDSEDDIARRAGARETLEECGLRLDPSELITYAEWTPPDRAPVRIRTWFFVAPDPGGELELAPDEVVDARWGRPDELLAAHARDELVLVPPTWVTLHALAGQADAQSTLSFARIGGPSRFHTVQRRGDSGPMVLWSEDAEYESGGASAESTARHRLEMGVKPWVYVRNF